jgi:hypothetical protein
VDLVFFLVVYDVPFNRVSVVVLVPPRAVLVDFTLVETPDFNDVPLRVVFVRTFGITSVCTVVCDLATA